MDAKKPSLNDYIPSKRVTSYLVLTVLVLLMAYIVVNNFHQEKRFTDPTGLSEIRYNTSADSPVRINTSDIGSWKSKNLFLYKSEDTPHLESNAYLLIPESQKTKYATKKQDKIDLQDQPLRKLRQFKYTPYISKKIGLPKSKKIEVGIEAKNAALLIPKPALMLNKDCAESKIILNITEEPPKKKQNMSQQQYKSKKAKIIVDNRIKPLKMDISKFRGKKVSISILLKDMDNCGYIKNEATLIKSMFISTGEHEYSLL